MIADSGRFSKSYPCRRTTERYLKGRHLGFNKHMLSVFVLACAVWFLFWRTFLLCRFRIRKFTCSIVFYLLFNASEFALTNTSVRFHYSVNTDIVSNNRRKSRMCWYHASNEISNRTLSCEYETTLLSRPVLYSVVISFQTNETWLNLSNTNCQLTHACMYGTPIS